MRHKNKPGRNKPCPCGSGKKYKKCCGRKAWGKKAIQAVTEIPARIKAKLQERIRSEKRRRKLFGEGKPFITLDHKGYKFVAVGSRLYWSKHAKTPVDFLKEYIVSVLGRDWMKVEKSKPFDEGHEILKWHNGMLKRQPEQRREKDGLLSCIPNGAMQAYLLLAYDLYTIQHNASLQKRVIERLKNRDDFQGARHELFAAATCVRAGFDIDFEDETDTSRTHPEFIATHRQTGQKVSVEAKSRRRQGILGRQGQRRPDEEVRVRIGRLLNDAFEKEVVHPYAIFVDLNLPPSQGGFLKEEWFRSVAYSVKRTAGDVDTPDPFNLLVFTNHPYHYGEDGKPAPCGVYFSTFSNNPKIPISHPEVLMAIHDAASKHGNIPISFEEG